MYRNDDMRKSVANEAARLMSEQGISDFQLAKTKAAARLGYSSLCTLPKNSEIQAALHEYQGIFYAASQHDWLLQLRQIAMGVMQLFSAYRPRLVGPVLHGNVHANSKIYIHVFSDSFEDVLSFLRTQQIVHRLVNGQVKYRHRQQQIPRVEFYAADAHVCLSVFREIDIRQAPLSPVTGRVMQRATVQQLERLLQGASSADSEPPAG